MGKIALAATFAAAAALGWTTTASAALLAEESFVGYEAGFLLGQSTSSTVGYAGTETWARNTSQNAVRDFNADPTTGLVYPGLETDGGRAHLYRTSNFAEVSDNIARLAPATAITNTPEMLFFSALINADGYVARSNDDALHRAEVTFLHQASSALDSGRPLGFGVGGLAGEDNPDLDTGFFIRTESGRVQTGLDLAAGTNLVVLGIERPGGTGDNTYSLWLNPDLSLPLGSLAADFIHTEAFGIVVNNGSWGFGGFQLFHRFNFPQDVYADELRLGTTFESVLPLAQVDNGDPNGNGPVIPEPASIALIGLGGLALLGRRRGYGG